MMISDDKYVVVDLWVNGRAPASSHYVMSHEYLESWILLVVQYSITTTSALILESWNLQQYIQIAGDVDILRVEVTRTYSCVERRRMMTKKMLICRPGSALAVRVGAPAATGAGALLRNHIEETALPIERQFITD